MVCTFDIFLRGFFGQSKKLKALRYIVLLLTEFDSVFLFFGIKTSNQSSIYPTNFSLFFQFSAGKSQIFNAWITREIAANFVLDKNKFWRALCYDVRVPPANVCPIIVILIPCVKKFDWLNCVCVHRKLPNGKPYPQRAGVDSFPKSESTSGVDKRLRGADSPLSGAGSVVRVSAFTIRLAIHSTTGTATAFPN